MFRIIALLDLAMIYNMVLPVHFLRFVHLAIILNCSLYRYLTHVFLQIDLVQSMNILSYRSITKCYYYVKMYGMREAVMVSSLPVRG
jgi:hypothetical protein